MNRRRNSFITTLAVLLATAPFTGAHGQSTVGLSLEEAVRRALDSSDQIQAERATVKAGESSRAVARTGRLPGISIETSYMRLKEQDPAVIEMPPPAGSVTLGESTENSYSATISFRQPIFTGGEIEGRIDAADHSVRAARSGLAWRENGIELETRTAYWRLLEAEQRVTAIEERKRQVEENLANMRRRERNGVVTSSEVLTVEMKLAEVKLRLLRARNRYELAENRLALMTGLPAGSSIEPVTPLKGPGADFLPGSSSVPAEGSSPTDRASSNEGQGYGKDTSGKTLATLVENALSNRGDLARYRSSLRAARASERIERSGWYPDIFLAGEYSYARPNQGSFPVEDEFESSWSIGIVGRIEIGDMPRVYHTAARERAEAEGAAARLRAAEQEVRLSVREAYLEYESSREELELAKTMVRQAEENLAETETRVENGVALNEDLLEAQAVLLEARLSRTSALAGLRISGERLRREAGDEL
jgi:outer membrane protein TolC